MTVPEPRWPGRYNDGRSAASHIVGAALEQDRLVIANEDQAIHVVWPCDEIRLISKPGRDGLFRLGRAQAMERLTLRESDALAEVAAHCPKLRRDAYRGPGWRAVAIASGAAIGAILFLSFIVLPLVARQAKHWVSPRMEAALGQQTADTIIRLLAHPQQGKSDQAECRNPRGLEALARLVAPLLSEVTWTNAPRIRVVNAPMINAVALPGGQVLLFRGLIDFAAGPNEVAGVLAHEFAHIDLGHPVEMMIDHGSKSFLVGLLFGDVLGGSVVAGIAQTALSAKYSQDLERAADARGVALLTGAGLDAGPFGAFFHRLASRQGKSVLSFVESHPPSEERAKRIESAPAGGHAALDAEDWKALKSICD